MSFGTPHLVESADEFRQGRVTTLCGKSFEAHLWDDPEYRGECCPKCAAKRIAGKKYSSMAVEAQRVKVGQVSEV